MIDNTRPVDNAMNDNRAEKQTMRSLWADKFRITNDQQVPLEVPIYLTLSGAEGLDIQFLIEQRMIEITEVGSIAEKDQNKIVAVEKNKKAVLKLQKKFIGLDIIETDFNNVICGPGPLIFPRGKQEIKCRARIINLDLDSSLQAQLINDSIIFPVIEWIKKICTIHSATDHSDWTLCLTLNATLNWNNEISQYAKDLMLKNINHDKKFALDCRAFWGEDLFSLISHENAVDFSCLNRTQLQRLNMVFVPKLIAKLVSGDNWNVQTEHNICYGSDDCAPMVSWIMHFTRESLPMPSDNIYRSSLHEIFSHIGIIKEDGQLTKFS